MPTELRCNGTLYGIISDNGETIEVKCKRRGCGASADVVILHTILLKTGQVIETKRFSQPSFRKGK